MHPRRPGLNPITRPKPAEPPRGGLVNVARVPLCPAMAGTAMTVWPDDQVSCPEPGPAPRTTCGDPLPRTRGLRTALHLCVTFG
jgi:hypothetical protein